MEAEISTLVQKNVSEGHKTLINLGFVTGKEGKFKHYSSTNEEGQPVEVFTLSIGIATDSDDPIQAISELYEIGQEELREKLPVIAALIITMTKRAEELRSELLSQGLDENRFSVQLGNRVFNYTALLDPFSGEVRYDRGRIESFGKLFEDFTTVPSLRRHRPFKSSQMPSSE